MNQPLEILPRDRARVLLSNPRAIELANMGQQIRTLIAAVTAYPLTSDADVARMSAGASEFGAKWKDLDDERKSLTRPIRDDEATVNEAYRPALAALKDMTDAIKARIIAYQSDVRAQQAVLQLEASKAFQAGQSDRGVAVLTQVPVAAETPGLSVVDHWVAEIVDASAVPRSLCSPDPVKIEAYRKTGCAAPSGVRYVNHPIARRTGR